MEIPEVKCLAAWLVAALAIQAQEPLRNVQFSAFGTLGVAATDTRLVGYRRDGTGYQGTFDTPDWSMDTRFGLQVSGKLGETLLATVQFVSKLRYDNTYKPTPTWAALTWTPTRSFQVRAGIINLDLLSAGDLSNVGYTYLWVRPPVDVFGPIPLSSVKGLDVSQSFALASGASIEAKAYYGSSVDKVQADHLGVWDCRGGRNSGGSLKLNAGAFRARIGGSIFRFPNNLPEPVPSLQGLLRSFGDILGDPGLAASAASVDLRGRSLSSVGLSLAWEEGPYQIQGAIHRATSDSFLFPASWRGFASLGYRVGKVVPYGMFARAVSGRPPQSYLGALPTMTAGPLAPLAQGAVAALNGLTRARALDQSTVTAGLRWDFADKADLKVQVDRVQSHNATGLVYVPDPNKDLGWNGREMVFSVTLDFILGGGR